MNNKKVMAKINDLYTQFLATREQSRRVIMQSGIIRRAFGVKEYEIEKPVKDYERGLVLSEDDIRQEFNERISFWNWAKSINDLDRAKEFENIVYYFIDAVRFFNESLADEFQKSVTCE
ncbi:hypothetical protein P7D15_03055 [Bacillus cereus]|uniref:hypothetical protein n=1 Tax=Bacillus cereus group TaxID=86661 RepID=UPI002404CBEA|nr:MULTISPECIES: hypothetical protein [Bacillus cereus group]MDF9599401.1 hypothetical protein [Bacillus cereus]MDG1589733.1 hypothetical protein [Bacillus cereus]